MLLLAVAGCTSSGKPAIAPHLGAVVPDAVFVEEETEVRLTGEAFTPKATSRWGGTVGEVKLDTAFKVFVDDQPLSQVTWVDAQSLIAVVPAGLPLGKHTVRIVDPYGVSTSLADALEARQRQGAILTARLSVESSSVPVLKAVNVHLDVTNVGDSPADTIGALQLAPTGTAEVTALGVAGGKATLGPGEATRFELKWVSTKIGHVILSTEVRGIDTRTGGGIRVGPVTTPELQVVPPPDITTSLLAARKVVSRGQVIELVLETNNVGGGGVLGLLPTALARPVGSVALKTTPVKRDVLAGAKQLFSFFFDTIARGDVAFRVDGLGVDALTGATVAMSPAFETVSIVERAQLVLALTASASRVAPGQRWTLTATVTNPGDAKALAVTPSIAITGAGSLTLVSAPLPAAVGTAAVSFVWQYDATTAGAVQLTVGASGTDENSAAPVTAAPMSVNLWVGQSSLAATFVTPARVNAGQKFPWSMDVANTGTSAATAVTTGMISLLGSAPGSFDGGASPPSQNIPAGTSRNFASNHTAGDAGWLRFQASPSGTDAVDGTPVTAPLATSAIIQIDRPARLTGTLSLPAQMPPSSQITATLQVTNSGDAVALAVTPSALAITGSATLVSGPTPASAPVSSDGGVTFSWTLSSGTSGTVQVAASAAGTDGNDATPVSTGPLTSILGAITGEVVLLASDPFADSTSFSFVFSYLGRVWLGPRKTGFGAISMNADGTGPTNHAFAFNRDPSIGATHANTSAAPYPSVGAQGCTLNTSGCGPNNEHGRGLFFSGMVGTTEFMGISGAHPTSGAMQYAYYTTTTAPTLTFNFLDMSGALGGASKGLSAALLFNNRLYLGLPDTGGNRPYLLSQLSFATSPGLNAVIGKQPAPGVDVLNLDGTQLPSLGKGGGNPAPTQIIDAMAGFNDRLYIANNGGIIRSTTNVPVGPVIAPADWSLTTPSSADFTAMTSVTTIKVSELLPSDKAFPAFATYKGRLYAARNTVLGPQLWVCTPGLDTFCAPSEWSLVAPNTQGNGQLSQFNSLSNQTIGLLAASATTLFIGFNNPTGVQIFKTTASVPSTGADFTGTGGCIAGAAGCQGLGSDGLGAPAVNQQIFDARVLTFALSSWLYLVTGNGVSGVQVWRIGG